MKIGDLLYFAPGIRFSDVDLNGKRLPEQFARRVCGFYLDPAEESAMRGHTFAAGVLLVTCIDSLARLRFGGEVGMRFKKFARQELPSFSETRTAERFYEEFRNGLVHEGRLKEGAQFSIEIENTLNEIDGVLLINPKFLAEELRTSLTSYIDRLSRDEAERARLATVLRGDHVKDFELSS